MKRVIKTILLSCGLLLNYNAFVFGSTVAVANSLIQNEELEIIRKSDKEKKENPKKTVKKNLKIANKLVSKNKFYEAIDFYKKVLEVEPDNAEVCYQVAEMYRFARYYKDAEKYYRSCAIKDQDKFPLVYFWLGMMQKALCEFDEAKQSFNIFMNKYTGEDEYYKTKAAKEIISCEYAAELVADPLDVEINNMGTNINQRYSDNGTAISDKTLYFQATESVSKSKKERVKGTKGVYDSLFIIRMFKSEQDEYGEWSKREKVEIPIQAREYNIGSPSISYDGTKMYFTVCQTINEMNICNIYYSISTGTEWGKPVRLKSVNSKVASSKYPYVFYDAQEQKEYLIYSSNIKGGMGKYDIYYASIESDGSVSEPVNMGEQINTLDDEVTPFYDPVNGYLYFSSSGHIGIGELDVFKVKGSISGGFEEPENIGYPLNSCADDYYFANVDSTDKGEKIGFLSSNRSGGLSQEGETCCDDIYSFTWRTKPQVLNLGVSGFVYNEDTKEPIDDVLVELLLAEYDSLKGSQNISSGQKFYFDLKQDNNYYLKASKNNYAPTKVSVSTFDKLTHDTIQADIYMKEIILPPVYHGFSKKEVVQSSYEALEKLISVMKEYPSMALQINSHTDNVGSEDFNLKLSEKRAKAVKDYLAKNDIDASRIVEQYYGESMPAAPNTMADGSDNPDGRQMNRRSEFNMLTSIESVIVDRVVKSEDGTTQIMATKLVLPIVYFGFDRFDLTDVAEEKLDALIAVVNEYPGSIIEVNAHTDSQGSSDYNEKLSKKRAGSVMEYINKKGLRDDVIQGSWEGEERPIKSNETIEGRAKNRRAEFRILKDGKLIGVSGNQSKEEEVEYDGENLLEEEEIEKVEELFED